MPYPLAVTFELLSLNLESISLGRNKFRSGDAPFFARSRKSSNGTDDDGERWVLTGTRHFFIKRKKGQPVPGPFPRVHPPGRVRNDNRLHGRSTFPHRLHPVRFIAANNALRDEVAAGRQSVLNGIASRSGARPA